MGFLSSFIIRACGFVLEGFCPRGFYSRGFCPRWALSVYRFLRTNDPSERLLWHGHHFGGYLRLLGDDLMNHQLRLLGTLCGASYDDGALVRILVVIVLHVEPCTGRRLDLSHQTDNVFTKLFSRVIHTIIFISPHHLRNNGNKGQRNHSSSCAISIKYQIYAVTPLE